MNERTCQLSFSVVDSAGSRREWSVRVASPVVITIVGFLVLRGLVPVCTQAVLALTRPPKEVPAAAAHRAGLVSAQIAGIADASGLAPGNVYGQGADLITPLNVRDPAALVMPPSR